MNEITFQQHFNLYLESMDVISPFRELSNHENWLLNRWADWMDGFVKLFPSNPINITGEWLCRRRQKKQRSTV